MNGLQNIWEIEFLAWGWGWGVPKVRLRRYASESGTRTEMETRRRIEGKRKRFALGFRYGVLLGGARSAAQIA